METVQHNPSHTQPPGAVRAVLTGRCPVCRTGDVFVHPVRNLSGFLRTHKNCPHCGIQYEPEPGFFWGAMYVNYGFNVATIAAVGLFVLLVFNPASIFAYILPIITAVVLTIPFTARISRMIMLHAFGPFRFDPSKYDGGKS